MADVDAAYAVYKAALLADRPAYGGSNLPLRWQNEDADSEGKKDLPDEPAPFVYSEMLVDASGVIAIGGGRGNNLHRNRGRIVAYVLIPKGWGVAPATIITKQIAGVFRPFNESGLTVEAVTESPGGDGAELKPRGLSSLVNSYYYATVNIDFHADQIG